MGNTAVREYMTVEPNTVKGLRISYIRSFPRNWSQNRWKDLPEFGGENLEILDQDPEQLLKIKRFTRKQLQAVKEGREDQQGFREWWPPPWVK